MELNYSNLLLANYSRINQRLHEKIRGTELSPGQPKVLNYLLENDGATQKDVAAGCFLTPGALTTILKKMEGQDLISRRKEDGNKKEVHIYMTDKGREFAYRAEEIFRELEEDLMFGLTADEREVFMKLFTKIYQDSL